MPLLPWPRPGPVNGSYEDGVLLFDPNNLPPGYRFSPTDTELLVVSVLIFSRPGAK